MAVSSESLTGADAAGGKAQKSKVPTLLLALLGLAGGATFVYDTFGKSSGMSDSSPRSSDPDDQPILVPDSEGAAKMIADTDAEADAGAEETTQGPTLDLAEEGLEEPGSPGASVPDKESFEQRASRLLKEQELQHELALRAQQLELERKAYLAPSTVKEFEESLRAEATANAEMLRGLTGEGGGEAAFGEMLAPLRAMASARANAPGGAQGPGHDEALPGGADSMAAAAADKRQFFQQGGQQLDTGMLAQKVIHQQSPYELHMGDVIPGELISGINSESPGQIIGQVSEDVCDSTTGEHLLIPQGSRLVGTYSATIAQGQARIQVAWVRLRMPNGDRLDLEGMSGADQQGVAGFHDRVNRHFGARLAAALMTSALTVAYEMTAPVNGSLYGSAVHRGVGENIVQLGTEMAQQEGRIPPTLEIRPGYRFNIMVKDIRFAGPYIGAGRETSASCSRPGRAPRQ